ncbi:DnaA regulatory inactivator Hda [Variovorax sp. SCN 67-20]|uniref:DnaA regulatory inactivator Hda n=1 Tax=Variovorax sp. SCN 67-20 TaxID=1660153 RepID=UPI0025F6C853|nr:DnaA regulatory inactivator Hda [Variovorax sp. SCN 67-20]
MKQLALDIGIATGPSFDAFFAGPNEAALRHLQVWVGGAGAPALHSPVPTYLWGEGGSGKTHLLESVRVALREQGASVGWLHAGLLEPPEFDERWGAVLLDDVHLYTAVQQHAAFNWFVNAQTLQRGVVAAGALPPADLPLREDLRTRLGWGLVFHIVGLDDDGKKQALQNAARERGLQLATDVPAYLLTHFERDMSSLMALLDRLDRFSMEQKRAVTLPLLRQMLTHTDPAVPEGKN